jgi:hypothetical protein
VGAIVALAPDLSVVTSLLGVDDATVRKVLHSWGPGKFDAELFLDGKAFSPDGKSGAVLFHRSLPNPGSICIRRRRWASMYRIAPLSGLVSHEKGGFYHDGRYPDLRSVVDHYDSLLKTWLTDAEKTDSIAYLRTL